TVVNGSKMAFPGGTYDETAYKTSTFIDANRSCDNSKMVVGTYHSDTAFAQVTIQGGYLSFVDFSTLYINVNPTRTADAPFGYMRGCSCIVYNQTIDWADDT